MTSLANTISFGHWTPAPLSELDRENCWPAFSLRMKKDTSDPQLASTLNNIIREWRVDGVENGLFDGVREILALTPAHVDHLVDCIRADHFSPQCTEWAADRLGVPVWYGSVNDNPVVNHWAGSSAAAYTYITTHPDAPQEVVDKVRDLRAAALATRNDELALKHAPEGNEHAYTLEVLKDVWANRPQTLTEQLDMALNAAEDNTAINDWARSLLHAIAQEDTEAVDILSDPSKLGRTVVLKYFLTDTCADMTYLNILWWNRFLGTHPQCEAAWKALDGTKQSETAYLYESNMSRRVLGREFFPSTKNGNRKETMVTYSSSMTETHILNQGHGSKVLAMMASHPDGRAEIVRAVRQDVVLKLLLENQNAHGIGPAQLLAWGGQAIKDWRDKNGCSLGHYAVSVTSTVNNADLEAMRMIRWVPEWRDVVPKNGAEIADMVTQPKNRAAFDRSSMRVAVGGQKAGAVVVQKRRM